MGDDRVLVFAIIYYAISIIALALAQEYQDREDQCH